MPNSPLSYSLLIYLIPLTKVITSTKTNLKIKDIYDTPTSLKYRYYLFKPSIKQCIDGMEIIISKIFSFIFHSGFIFMEFVDTANLN